MLKPLIIALKPLIVALGAARAGAQRMSTALRGILNAAKQAARRGLERLRDRWRGCALSLRVFGQPIRPLYLAANWMRYFRRAAPGPHMVAARKGHVMQLLAHVEGARWLVYDPNSGGGLTRVHVRSISGFVVVDPWTKE